MNVLKQEVQLQSLTATHSVHDQHSFVFEMYSAILSIDLQWYKERRDGKTMDGQARGVVLATCSKAVVRG